jgi:3-phosphoshikimate 1-carboxyvinyltransferase
MRYEIQLPDNKSIKIRRMVTTHVRGGEIPPVTDADGSDVRVTWHALQAIRDASAETCHGASLQTGNPSLSPVVIDVADCGAAYRFLMPVLAATPGTWLLTGTERLLQRPILPLVEVLRGIGAEIERVGDGWLIHGKTLSSVETRHGTSLQRRETETDNETGGLSLTLDATQSSQMASALVMAAPLLNLRTLRLTTTDIPSLSYLHMTLALTRNWPVEIPGVEAPDIPVGAPGDWSAALFWFAHARLHPENEYLLSQLSLESIQGDSIIAKWFRELNVSVSYRDAMHCVSTSSCIENTPIPCVKIAAKPLAVMPCMVLDVRDNLDTVPVMAALAALLPADITFQNVRNLRYKESDRLQVLADQLAPYAEIELSDNVLRVKGKGKPIVPGRGFETHHDHRLAMAFLLFPGAVLDDVGCLEKSYPGLLKQM